MLSNAGKYTRTILLSVPQYDSLISCFILSETQGRTHQQMKSISQILIIAGFLIGLQTPARADDAVVPELPLPRDPPQFFSDEYAREMGRSFSGLLIFPGVEIGMGSGTLSAALAINLGFHKGGFVIGTALKGQVINIDRVNYQFMPYTLNIIGVSYSRIPETSNNINQKTLEGWSLGYAKGGKFSFSLLTETNPVDNSKKEYLTFGLGLGF